MLIQFLGSPSTGKTTTAAGLFSSMKETEMVSEYLPEQARVYIALIRSAHQLAPTAPLTLDDSDQFNIMSSQVGIYEAFVSSCGPDVYLVSDSSPLNSLLYMTPEFRATSGVKNLVKRTLALQGAVFRCLPIYSPYQTDPNRIHTAEQSKLIDSTIPEILKDLSVSPILIHGTVRERLLMAKEALYGLLA
jgi:hypothetical protein